MHKVSREGNVFDEVVCHINYEKQQTEFKVTQSTATSMFLTRKASLEPYTSVSLKLRKEIREELVTFLNSIELKIIHEKSDNKNLVSNSGISFIYVFCNKISVT